ncbi:MAG: UDP-4-amino-4,6-dideoxy-N-acetyl-beta-L-altrosamine transaminase [Solirubrobacteraceae bacterium]
MTIPYGRQSIEEDDIEAVTAVLRGDWLTQGPAVVAFEEAVARVCEAPFAVAFSSGTAALHAAAFAAGIGPGDELVTSAITFAASANCAAYVGATPRFADIDPATWNLSVETVAAAVTDRTRAVVPVHFAGLPAPVAALRERLGDGVVIIEDAAHAIGACQTDERVGACRHSDMAIFSFHPVKTITCAEGGIVTTRDAEFARRLAAFRTHGMVRAWERLRRPDEGGWYAEQQALGFNYRLSDVHSALGVSQLAKLERFVMRRNEIAARYRQGLGDVAALTLAPEAAPGERHGRHLYVVCHREGAAARRRLYDGLRERGILAQVHYLPVYLHPFYADTYGFSPGLCPHAESYYAGCLSLPCFPTLTDDEQDVVIAAVRALS